MTTETRKLRENLENQLERLVTQLEDLDACRDDLGPEEYSEARHDTLEQLGELNESLARLVKGDISLVSSLEAVMLATKAAVSQSFKTLEVIRLFGKREPKLLREKLVQIEEDVKAGRLDAGCSATQKAEVLTALRQLGEQLSSSELQFLQQFGNLPDSSSVDQLVQVGEEEDN